jgi:methylglyoxal synthase
MNTTNSNTTKRIAFVVHADKKSELIEWSYFNKQLLAQHHIIASGDAANILEGTLNTAVQTYITGPYNGYQELGAMIAEGSIDTLILFGHNDEAPLQANGIKALIETALEANVVIALNKITADYILQSALINKKKPEDNKCYSLPVVQDNAAQKMHVA